MTDLQHPAGAGAVHAGHLERRDCLAALGIGLVGVAVIAVLWWVRGALLGERRRLWRSS